MSIPETANDTKAFHLIDFAKVYFVKKKTVGRGKCWKRNNQAHFLQMMKQTSSKSTHLRELIKEILAHQVKLGVMQVNVLVVFLARTTTTK